MENYANIYYRAARFFSVVPIDMQHGLTIAVLTHADLLAHAASWIIVTAIQNLAWMLIVYFAWRFWWRLPHGLRRVLLKLRDAFLPAEMFRDTGSEGRSRKPRRRCEDRP